MSFLKPKKTKEPTFFVNNLITFILVAGLVFIAIVDGDYRLNFHNLATSVITYNLLNRNHKKNKF